MSSFMAIPFEYNINDVKNNIFFNYPKDNSVLKQLFVFTYMLFSEEFWQHLSLGY